MSQYENGKHAPAQQTLIRIAAVLNLPFHFFLRPMPPEKTGTKFYRSMSTATKAARIKAESRYQWLCDLIGYVRNYVQLQTVVFPASESVSDPRDITDELIEAAATRCRRHWRLGDGPISNVTWLIENNGAIIARYPLEAAKLDAFSEWRQIEGRPYIVLGADKGSAVRSRFDLAHELAHMILHRDVPPVTLATPELFVLVESQADKFAGSFLLPAITFAEDVYSPGIDAFCAIKPKWKVSIGAMIARAGQLRLIDADQERRLWINRTRRGWNNKEPLDDTLEPESPRYLKRAIELLIEKRVVSRHDLAFQLGLTAKDIEILAGLNLDYLSDADEDVELLKFPSIAGGTKDQESDLKSAE
jgi:Zn-dependent peptidase ImmA (M78 family)